MSRFGEVRLVAQKEFKDALRSRVFLAFLAFLLILSGVSITVASLAFQAKVATYHAAVLQLQRSGQAAGVLTRPTYHPLTLLRPSIEYLEIIGAILAIVLGYLSVAKEKGTNTLQLILTRPITRLRFLAGKLLGNTLLLTSVAAVVFLALYGALTIIGHAPLTSLEVTKLIITFVSSVIYLAVFFCLSVTLSLSMRSLPNALIVCFIIWLFFVLIVPQIGDTLDPDNQVPNGLFASLHMTKPQEMATMKSFSRYETIRNAVEEASLAKHYERLSFALLGIKDKYLDKPLKPIFRDKTVDMVWLGSLLMVFATSAVVVFSRKAVLWGEHG